MEDVIYYDGGHTHNKHTPHGVESCYFQSPIFIRCIVCAIKYTVDDKSTKSAVNDSFFDRVGLLDTYCRTKENISDEGRDVVEFFGYYGGIVHNLEPDKIEDDENGYGD